MSVGANVVPADQYFHIGQLRRPPARRCVQLKPALLYQLHRCGSGQRFGHGRDPYDGVGCHRSVLTEHALAESAFVDRAFPGGGCRDHAWDIAFIGGAPQQRVGGFF